ncbi:putative transposase, partial [Candidatus Hakubella thermalkaliphila]
RGIKQCCGIERAQVRKAVAQKNHFLYALRAFLRLEIHKLRTGNSWYEQLKTDRFRLQRSYQNLFIMGG